MTDYGYLLIEGRPDTGLRFYGPFVAEDEAVRWAEKHLFAKDWWWVATLEHEV